MKFDLDKKKQVLIAGSRGMVGSACVREFGDAGYVNILAPTRKELDYSSQQSVTDYFNEKKPAYVILSAARVGGIKANMEHPYEFLSENLAIQNNIIEASLRSGVEKLVFLGSSCIYPKQAPQPMREEYLLTGPLEPTNEGYALAKIAGLKEVEYIAKQYNLPWISLMPPNLYGKNDHFDLVKSHVMSALVKKFTDAKLANSKSVEVWGTGKARREFMNVTDAARAVRYFFETYHEPEFINIGPGEDVSILELVDMVKLATGYTGNIIWDKTKPDGMMKKCLDTSKMKELGFSIEITLEQGIKEMVTEYTNSLAKEGAAK